jgi:hypothetical protein
LGQESGATPAKPIPGLRIKALREMGDTSLYGAAEMHVHQDATQQKAPQIDRRKRLQSPEEMLTDNQVGDQRCHSADCHPRTISIIVYFSIRIRAREGIWPSEDICP